MFFLAIRAACLALVLTSAGARADNLADFNAAVEITQSHNRVAIGYLRTGNVDLASVEVDRLRETWRALQQRFAGSRPDVFAGNELYGRLWTVVDARLIAADLMLKTGRADAARQSLDAIRGDLHELRKSARVVVLADCMREAATVAEALLAFDGNALTDVAANATLARTASDYGALLTRCDSIAGEAVRGSPEFRRLIDGAQAGLTFIPKAIAARDGDLVHRVMGELRAIDNLLAFRFG